MKSNRQALLTLCLLLVLPTLSFAQQIDVRGRVALIEKAIAEEMEKNSVPGVAVAIALDGFGWTIATDQGKRRVEHSGGSMGATAILTKYPEQGLIIAALVNCDHYSAPQIKIRIAKILFEGSSQTQ